MKPGNSVNNSNIARQPALAPVSNYIQPAAAHRSVRVLAQHETPPVGAHLVTPWLGFAHHGIYVGDDNVVHYGALVYDLIRKPVEEVSLARFAEGRPVFVVEHTEACFDADEVIRRARSRLGEKRYRLLSNNCEHFCEWALHGEHRSFQAELTLAFPRLMGERIQGTVLRALRRVLFMRRPMPADLRTRLPARPK